MMETLTTPVTGPSAWTRNDLENDRSLMIHLTSKQIRELQSAREALTQRNLPHSQVKKTHFPLPTLGRKLVWLQQDLEDGRGFAILRGVPTDCTIDDAALMWAGVAAHLGTTITLDTMGTRIEPVFDRGLSYDNIKVTGGYTNAALTPHCDSGDLLGLLCLRPAMSGGTTILSSAMTIFNEILAAHPEYLKPLFSGFHYNIRGKGPPGKGRNITLHRNPVYDYFKGRLSIRYNQKAIKTAEQLPGVERLTNLQKQAIDYVAEVASRPENSFRISLKAGDLALLNNNVILHNSYFLRRFRPA